MVVFIPIETGVDIQNHKYNGKEFDSMNGLNLYDYSARQYDATIGQFTSMDLMNTKIESFTFSIFIGCDFDMFTETVRHIYKEYIEHKNCQILENTILNLENYSNPEVGAHKEHFSWWKSDLYNNIVFLSSNQDDGLFCPCLAFRKALKCVMINCRISTGNNSDINSFSYSDDLGNERVIMALKEDRWIFYQKGKPLPFEDLSLYDKRKIKDRINLDVIINYLQEIGINYHKIDTSVSKCCSLERLAWE